LAPVFIGWLMLCTPAMASTFGVSLSASGSAGDACQLAPQIAAEGFNSGNLTSSYSLSYTGSAVGYDNSFPYPAPGPEGCVYSPAFAHVNDSGVAALGVLMASASADMETVGLLQAAGSIGDGFFDTITAVTGGTYVVTFELNASESGSCPGGGQSSVLNASATVTGAFLFDEYAHWNNTDCTGSTAPYQTFGPVDVINSYTVELPVTLSAGGSFGVSASLYAGAGVGFNESAAVGASETTPQEGGCLGSGAACATLTVTGLNGATYTTASGVTYGSSDPSAPEPASCLLIGCALAALGLRRISTRSTHAD